ncbi:hypothetical protein QQS21_004927 [Conoideocrella luteorostrata]|uniref:Uncharacterized protein n=1 Tax=Conoideocrella luteorostrata TaxID=1105319 RepID=A0AAJ0CQP8_9HYPO|nr:hypothetical protein QQS21_004927 [Conoideocrella luteorostrata]
MSPQPNETPEFAEKQAALSKAINSTMAMIEQKREDLDCYVKENPDARRFDSDDPKKKEIEEEFHKWITKLNELEDQERRLHLGR